MTPLRVALGIVACLALAAAGVGAVMSVKINWEFATTLGRNPVWAFYLALIFAAVEVCRIMMPFVAKGLKVAGFRATSAHFAFWLFTALSVTSAAGFFAMNRADASSSRGLQVSETMGYASELKSINKRLERELGRSLGEVEADLKAASRHDPRRLELEKEKAAHEQRAKDLERLAELRGMKVWQTAVASKDAQAEALADALPFDKATTERWVALGGIFAAVVCIELLVGFTPFASIMVLVWACTRPEVAAAAMPAETQATAPPADHVGRFVARCINRAGSVQFRPLYESYLNFCVSKGWQPLSEYHFKPAMHHALGTPAQTEKRKPGIFWLGVSLKPELMMGGARAA